MRFSVLRGLCVPSRVAVCSLYVAGGDFFFFCVLGINVGLSFLRGLSVPSRVAVCTMSVAGGDFFFFFVDLV